MTKETTNQKNKGRIQVNIRPIYDCTRYNNKFSQ